VPVWSVRYLPTADGPSHLYNASLLLRLAARLSPTASSIYMIDWHPSPNWLGHLLLALLMTSLSPVVAERLLFSAIVVLFLTGAWMLAGVRGEQSRVYAFLAFPLAFHQSLQFGDYDFCLATGLYLVIVALWWSRRDDPSPRNLTLIGGLLLLSYSSHPLPTLLAIASIGVLWLVSSRDFRHLLALIPATAMLLWYARTQPSIGTPPPIGRVIDSLTHVRFLLTFDERQLRFGIALFVLYLSLAIATLWIGPRRNAFAFLVLAFLILYFVAPSHVALFLFLVPIAWFTPDLPPRVRTGLVAILSVIAIATVIFMTQRYRAAGRVMTEIVRTFDAAEPDSKFIPLLFDARPPRSYYPLLMHTADYAAVQRNLIDLTNYEAQHGGFPIRYRAEHRVIESGTIDPMKFRAADYVDRADLIFTWKMPPGTETERSIIERYTLLHEWGAGRLYSRR
jgi:hypothetical protein